MKIVVAFDTETELIRPGLLAPPMSCLTWARAGLEPRIKHWSDARPVVEGWLRDPNTILVGHNVAYDMGVICAQWPELIDLVFAAYEADRVTDTMLRQKLLDIAGGCYRRKLIMKDGQPVWIKRDYSLQACVRDHVGVPFKKEGFRLFYGFLRNTPLDQWVVQARCIQGFATNPSWVASLTDEQRKELPGMIAANPEEVVTYPLDDATGTLKVHDAQEPHADFLHDQFRQARAAWWLHLMSAWGLRTNFAAVEDLRIKTESAYEQVKARLVDAGLVRKDGSRDTKAAKALMEAASREAGFEPRLTPAGQVCLDGDACDDVDHPVLNDYSDFSTLGKVLGTDIPMLASGARTPIHSRFDLAETGRTTSSNPNIQNLRRMPGIREVIRPRPGFVFAQADFDQLELRTLAQVCLKLLGQSTLAEILNAGRDPHLEVARNILNISYDEAKANKKRHDVDMARQAGKVANFGFPGGLGPKRLCYFAKKTYGVELTESKARDLKDIWTATLPEMKPFFDHVNSLPEGSYGRFMQQVMTVPGLENDKHRFRGNTTFSQACIGYYQGLGGDATKEAGWRIARAMYTDRESPLFGSRLVCYVHDEFIAEVPRETAHYAAHEMTRLMIEGAGMWLPDVRPSTEPVLMEYWSKEAQPVWEDGKLIPWSADAVARAA